MSTLGNARTFKYGPYLKAVVVTILLAGPITWILAEIVFNLLSDPSPPDPQYMKEMTDAAANHPENREPALEMFFTGLPMFIVFCAISTIVALPVSVPAAFSNGALIELWSWKYRPSWVVAVISGSICGAAFCIPYIQWDAWFGTKATWEPAPIFIAVEYICPISGALMGLTYYWVARRFRAKSQLNDDAKPMTLN
jgi:hypothetical protein